MLSLSGSVSSFAISKSKCLKLTNSKLDTQQSRWKPRPTYVYGPLNLATYPAATSAKTSEKTPFMFKPGRWARSIFLWKPHQQEARSACWFGEIWNCWTCHLELATLAQNSTRPFPIDLISDPPLKQNAWWTTLPDKPHQTIRPICWSIQQTVTDRKTDRPCPWKKKAAVFHE